ncbi:hypothetical protein ABD91_20680 [Lysinibacillus sphaericus]|uniref:hypothetical protein n=1 Tax=Lysinibacillus sphaericus TaxID=1421 RepID=UPI0018CF7D12|nr:hypothetical protein [Lysinibacillus sphaericus]MBG9693159.1 hypothetical protein [Lysinibacillus sphaericus]
MTQASLGEANLILRDVISLQNNNDKAKKVMMDYASKVDFEESKHVFTKPCMFRNILDYANSRYMEGIFTSEKDALIYLYAFFRLGKFSQVDSKESFMEYCEANIEALFQRIKEEEDDLLIDDSDDEWELEWRSEWKRDFNEELPLE